MACEQAKNLTLQMLKGELMDGLFGQTVEQQLGPGISRSFYDQKTRFGAVFPLIISDGLLGSPTTGLNSTRLDRPSKSSKELAPHH